MAVRTLQQMMRECRDTGVVPVLKQNRRSRMPPITPGDQTAIPCIESDLVALLRTEDSPDSTRQSVSSSRKSPLRRVHPCLIDRAAMPGLGNRVVLMGCERSKKPLTVKKHLPERAVRANRFGTLEGIPKVFWKTVILTGHLESHGGNMETVHNGRQSNSCESDECDAFQFMARHLGITVLHPGGLAAIEALAERGIDFDQLAEVTGQTDADPFDLLCHVAYSAPLRTRRERATSLKTAQKAFFEQYGTEAKTILDELLEKYAEHGVAQFEFPDILKVPPISNHGNVIEIARFFGGPEKLNDAVNRLQALLYAA